MNVKLQFIQKNFTKEDLFSIQKHTFESGLIHGLIGHNGAGKTTLLKILGGLDRDYKGTIQYGHRDYSDELIKKITYISQDPYMLNRTVYDNIAYPLKIRKMQADEIHKKTMEMLERFEIMYLKDRNARVLSAGEKERVSLARGLVFEPRLILLDEPTANIAPDSVNELEQIIVNYQRENKATVIVVTHNLIQAIRLCDTLTVMKDKALHTTSKEKIFNSIEKLESVESLFGLSLMTK